VSVEVKVKKICQFPVVMCQPDLVCWQFGKLEYVFAGRRPGVSGAQRKNLVHDIEAGIRAFLTALKPNDMDGVKSSPPPILSL